MFRRVWVLVVAFPCFLLTLPFAYNAITPPIVHAASIAKSVNFAVSADAPNPNSILQLVNMQRLSQDLEPLVGNERLGKLAEARAADMVNRQYYAHQNPDGKYFYDFLKQYGVEAPFSCENLDLVFSPSIPQIVADWANSNKGHRECMLTNGKLIAGYAAKPFALVQANGAQTTAYIIVAIHAQQS